MHYVIEPPRLPKAPSLLDQPEPEATVKAPLTVCVIGAVMGWALVAECLWASDPAHAILEWFGWWVLYPFGLFALVMTALSVRFAFVRRVRPSIGTTVNALLAGIEVLVLGASLWLAAVVFVGR
jgi:integral membrane sensor domain MASE1